MSDEKHSTGNSLLDQVARAIAVAQWGEENCAGDAWRALPDIFPAAQAAIKAIEKFKRLGE